MSDLDFAADARYDGDLDVRWIHGSPRRCARHRPALPGAPLRPAHLRAAAEQGPHRRGAVPVPAVRRRAGGALRHRREQEGRRKPSARDRGRNRRRVARRAPARGLRARRRSHPRPSRPCGGRRAVRRPTGDHRRRPRAGGRAGVLRLHRLAGPDRPLRPRRRSRAGADRHAGPPACDGHDLRPLERFPAHRRQRVAGPDLRLRLPRLPRQHGTDGRVRPHARDHARDGLPHRDDPAGRGATTPSAAGTSPTSARCR